MKLKTLLKKVPLEVYSGTKEIEITGLCENSKKVAPGNLFIARRADSREGAQHIQEAIQSGAVAILAESGNPFIKGVTQLIHPHIPTLLGQLASTFYKRAHNLFTVGVTGTNGKTTVTYLLKHLLDHFGQEAGLIGTIDYLIGKKRCSAERTTPDVISNHKMLKEMVEAGCQAALMEVSSHGLMQGRVDGIDFDVAIFTNLTQDHLDYHHTMENYAEAKKRLFTSLSNKSVAVVFKDSSWHQKMVESTKASILTYGFSEGADLRATPLAMGVQGSTFEVHFKSESITFSWALIGKHNILNALAAMGSMIHKGFKLKDLKDPIRTFKSAPGRLERVLNAQVFVDYAHTPDALENVLNTLRELDRGEGRIITVFGCGGDRDKGKRPLMGALVDRLSDIAIVTSDNPRTEEPLAIVQEILKGFKEKEPLVILDRAEAIARAIMMKKREDLILIAGKGHETYQQIKHHTLPFDDRRVAMETLGLLHKESKSYNTQV